jgi:hypothetical protein
MTLSIADLKQQSLIVLDTLSGSRAYGLDTPQSDTDLRGVFILPAERYFGFTYTEQVCSERNDHVYYELGKYMKLLAKNNPSSIELLFAPQETIRYRHPLMAIIRPDCVVSRLCRDSFAGYALSQVKRAKGLNKKIFNPITGDPPRPLDYCHIIGSDQTYPAETWLARQHLQAERCGLSVLPHVQGGYWLFYADDCPQESVRFNGLFRTDNPAAPSQDVCLSSIPKGLKPRAWLVFNKDGYARSLRDYHAYRQWEQERNPARYQGTVAHGNGYDAKNMMHTFRLLRMAQEIATSGQPLVRRPDRAELLAIKSGQFDYDLLMAKAAAELAAIDASFATSTLPASPNSGQIEGWAVAIRKAWYAERACV